MFIYPIGINVWDTCGNEDAALAAAVEAVVAGGFLEPPQCQASPNAGVLITPQDTESAVSFMKVG